jgi:AcrR family transcriptional regulator
MGKKIDQNKLDLPDLPPLPVPEDEANGLSERRDAAAHRRRILKTARSLFAEQGVDGTSMHQIAQAAGVGQGTLYRRYGHKGELCSALLKENFQQFYDDIESKMKAGGADVSALSHLEFLLERLVYFNEENGPLLGAIDDSACGERRTASYHSPFYRWLRQTVTVLLEGALQQEETRPLDVGYTADAILAPLSIDLYFFQRYELGYKPAQIFLSLRRLLFDGLRAG